MMTQRTRTVSCHETRSGRTRSLCRQYGYIIYMRWLDVLSIRCDGVGSLYIRIMCLYVCVVEVLDISSIPRFGTTAIKLWVHV